MNSEVEASERSGIQPTNEKTPPRRPKFTREATTQLRAPYLVERANLAVCSAEEIIGRRNAML